MDSSATYVNQGLRLSTSTSEKDAFPEKRNSSATAGTQPIPADEPQSFWLWMFWSILNVGLWGLGYKYAVRVRYYATLNDPAKINVWRDDQQKEWDRMNVTVSMRVLMVSSQGLAHEFALPF